MSIATRAAFVERAPEVLYVPDAFDQGGCYLREFTAAELAAWQGKCRTFGDDGEIEIDPDQLQLQQIVHCVLVSEDPAGPTLFSEADAGALPTLLKAGEIRRLVAMIDALSGYAPALLAELRVKYPTSATATGGSGSATEGGSRGS